jgi:hypothetical protein
MPGPSPIPAIAAGSWRAAGNRFFKRVIVPPIPISAYTRKATGIPLTGGQAQGALSGAGALTLNVGPQGLGTVWYPAQVTLSTGTGPLDTATALVYAGIGGVPVQLVGTVYTGNGTVALAVPPMTPGESIIVTWTGGTAGELATVNVVGTMDALMTG